MAEERDERSQPVANDDEKDKAFKAATHGTDDAAPAHPGKPEHPREEIGANLNENQSNLNDAQRSGDGFVEEPH
jgi:hypothetical protein